MVAIGASAAGLEALQAFWGNMPSETGKAFLIIRHVAPKGMSMPGDILLKHTRMKILDVQDGMRTESGHIHLNPPGNAVSANRSFCRLIGTSPEETL